MQATNKYRFVKTAICVAVTAALGGCLFDSSDAPPAESTISGVAASGAPLASATIVITCADGTTKSGTSDSNGAYSISVANCPAPYVITATGQMGDTEQTLVSMQPTAVTGAAIVNVTPLTHAIAATLATNGNPLSLASNIATEKANITASEVAARNTALAAAVAPAIAQAGVTGTVDLISTRFAADRSGLDKVLDNLKVVVTPSGVVITNVGGAKVDDMADQNGRTVSSDLSSAALTMSRSTNFSGGLTALPAAVDDASIADSIQAALNECFASTTATQRATTGCSTVPIASDYLHNGKNDSQEFGRLATSAYDRARFSKPEIIRFYSSSPTDTRALVRLGILRADGVGDRLETVVERSAATGNTFKMRGNQRQYKVFVNASIIREEQLETRGSGSTQRPKGAYYLSNINLYFGYEEGGAGGAVSGRSGTARGSGKRVAYVVVKGPGLPAAGVTLNPLLSGCDEYYAIASSSTSTPGSCTTNYRLQYRKATTSDPDNPQTQGSFGNSSNPEYASTQATDAALTAIQPFSAYRFEIFNVGNNTTTPNLVYVERLRSRPVALGTTPGSGEVDKLVFNTGLSAETKALINPGSGSSFTGGNSFTVRWTNVSGAPSIGAVQVQTRPTGGSTGSLYQDQEPVPFSASSKALTNGSVGWGDMSKATTSGNFNFVQLGTRDANDLQYFHNWRY